MILKIYDQRTEIVDPASLYMVSGSAGLYTIGLEFSEEWEGYTKTVIFRRRFSDDTETFLLTGDSIQVPSGMIAEPGEILIGIYGVKDELQKPTLWSGPYNVFEGCKEGVAIDDPIPSMYEQMLAEFGRILNLSASSVSDQVEISVRRTIVDGHYNFEFGFDFSDLPLGDLILDCGTSTTPFTPERGSEEYIDWVNSMYVTGKKLIYGGSL